MHPVRLHWERTLEACTLFPPDHVLCDFLLLLILLEYMIAMRMTVEFWESSCSVVDLGWSL